MIAGSKGVNQAMSTTNVSTTRRISVLLACATMALCLCACSKDPQQLPEPEPTSTYTEQDSNKGADESVDTPKSNESPSTQGETSHPQDTKPAPGTSTMATGYTNACVARYDRATSTLTVRSHLRNEGTHTIRASDMLRLTVGEQVADVTLSPETIEPNGVGVLTYKVRVDKSGNALSIVWGDSSATVDLSETRYDSEGDTAVDGTFELGDAKMLADRLRALMAEASFEDRVDDYRDGGLYSIDLSITRDGSDVKVEGSVTNNDDKNATGVVVGYAIVRGSDEAASLVTTGTIDVGDVRAGESVPVSVKVDIPDGAQTDGMRLVLSDVLGW